MPPLSCEVCLIAVFICITVTCPEVITPYLRNEEKKSPNYMSKLTFPPSSQHFLQHLLKLKSSLVIVTIPILVGKNWYDNV